MRSLWSSIERTDFKQPDLILNVIILYDLIFWKWENFPWLDNLSPCSNVGWILKAESLRFGWKSVWNSPSDPAFISWSCVGLWARGIMSGLCVGSDSQLVLTHGTPVTLLELKITAHGNMAQCFYWAPPLVLFLVISGLFLNPTV